MEAYALWSEWPFILFYLAFKQAARVKAGL